jgi:hypothetical protein
MNRVLLSSNHQKVNDTTLRKDHGLLSVFVMAPRLVQLETVSQAGRGRASRFELAGRRTGPRVRKANPRVMGPEWDNEWVRRIRKGIQLVTEFWSHD